MKRSQSGFTLIELVVVIVLLGILGVTALGKFQDLSGEASAAAVEGVASELSASASINYAKSLVSANNEINIGDGATAGAGNGDVNSTTAAGACLETGLDGLFAAGVAPTGYTIAVATGGNATPANACSNGAGDTYYCLITGENSATAEAIIVCTE